MKKNSIIIIRVIIAFIGLLLVSNITKGQCSLTEFCGGITVNAILDTDPLGCFIRVDFRHNWISCTGCNVYELPHGLFIKLHGATINSVSLPPGSWFTGAVQNPATLSNYVYWNKIPTGTCASAPSAIPSNQLFQIKIRISSVSSSTPIIVQVRELTGWSWPNDTSKWSCERSIDLSAPSINYDIRPDTSVCRGSALTLHINPAPGTSSQIKWYKYIPTSSSDLCPSINPLSSLWGSPVQIGGVIYNTNILTSTSCYVAVIDQGCWTYFSNVRRVTVCQGIQVSTPIVSTPIGSSLPLQNINGEWHACISWNGSLSITLTPNDCTPLITWERQVNTGPWTNVGSTLTINTGVLITGSECKTKYTYRVKLTNACGTNVLTYPIVIDHLPDGGTIKTLTNSFFDIGSGSQLAPIICNRRGTRLDDSTTCGKVKHWEYREDATICSNAWGAWTTISGSEGTYIWWTNNLLRSRQYRALVENGACQAPTNSAYSSIITVKVKPALTANITTTNNLLCMNPILSAHTSYDGCGYPITYQWYLNGSLITGATGSSYSPSQPGKYNVLVKDDQCHTSSKSNVITICNPRLTISAPCCICILPPYTPPYSYETVAISANIVYTPSPCGPTCTFLWSTGETTQTIHINHPGTYSVTVHCGVCTFTDSIIVTPCPHH